MSAARTREGAFGHSWVRLTGAENLLLEHAERTVHAQELAGRPRIDVIAAIHVVPANSDLPTGHASLLVEVEGDALRLLALLWSEDGIAAISPSAERDGLVLFAFEHATAGMLIRIIECDSKADVNTWLQDLNGAPTREQLPKRAERASRDEPTMGELSGALIEEGQPMIPLDVKFFEPEIAGLGAAPAEQRRAVPGIAPPTSVSRSVPTSRAGPVAGATAATRPDDEAGPAATPARDERGGAAASVPAHVSGEMPGATVAGQIAIVEATLSRDRVTPAAGAAFAEKPVQVFEDEPVIVSISTRGYRLVSGSHRVRSLSLKRGRANDVVRFALEAVDPGAAEVILVFRQNDEFPLATLRLVSQISTQAAPDTPVKTAADIVEPEADLLSMPTLRIDESVADGKSYLDVAAQIGKQRVQGKLRIVDKAQLVSDTYGEISKLRAARKRAREAVREGDVLDLPGLRRAALEMMRKIGVDLSLRLFTREMRQFLWDHVDELDHLVIQTTGELDIPWEIIYVSDPSRSVAEEPEVVVDHFLGMRGATRLVYSTTLPREVVVRRRRARYLCPSYTGRGLGLAFTHDEAELVRQALHAAVVRPGTAEAMSQLMTAGFDLLHFAGHGIWSTTPPDQRLLLARYRKSRPTAKGTAYSAATLRRDLPDRGAVASAATDATDASGPIEDAGTAGPTDATDPTIKMVFLNACDVGRTDSSVVGLGGFPEAFLRGGVGVLLGCSWAIDDEIGSTFSRHFYEALKTSDIADAMREARIRSLGDDDLSALAYVAYAHPHARVTVI